MDIAIFGAGIAGLMSAITLRAQGHRCRIFERARQGHETGMGFILMPEGIDCLQSFGVQLGGVPLRNYRGRSETGEILHETPMPVGSRAIMRRDLIASLVRTATEGANTESGVLNFDVELERLEFDIN